jgi:hypothetical protein
MVTSSKIGRASDVCAQQLMTILLQLKCVCFGEQKFPGFFLILRKAKAAFGRGGWSGQGGGGSSG